MFFLVYWYSSVLMQLFFLLFGAHVTDALEHDLLHQCNRLQRLSKYIFLAVSTVRVKMWVLLILQLFRSCTVVWCQWSASGADQWRRRSFWSIKATTVHWTGILHEFLHLFCIPDSDKVTYVCINQKICWVFYCNQDFSVDWLQTWLVFCHGRK